MQCKKNLNLSVLDFLELPSAMFEDIEIDDRRIWFTKPKFSDFGKPSEPL